MALTDAGNSNGMVMPVAPMNGGYGYNMGGGDWSFWIIILFLFAFMGNGFGNFGGTQNAANDVQRGFDQQAVMTGINGLNATLNANQIATTAGMNNLAMSLQNCCCENRAATADLKYTIATDGAATRLAVADGNQKIMDKLCQLELDGIKQNYENRISGLQNTIDSLREQVNNQNRIASQTAQTAQILADNAAQTTALEHYLNPTPIPAYMVQNPNCCGNNFGCGNTFAA